MAWGLLMFSSFGCCMFLPSLFNKEQHFGLFAAEHLSKMMKGRKKSFMYAAACSDKCIISVSKLLLHASKRC